MGDSVLLKYIGNSMRYTYVDCTENMTYVHDNWTESWTRVGWNECKCLDVRLDWAVLVGGLDVRLDVVCILLVWVGFGDRPVFNLPR